MLASPSPRKKIALLAGLDELPLLVIKRAKAAGDEILPILFSEYKNLYPADWKKIGRSKKSGVAAPLFLSIGQLGAAIALLQQEKITHVIMAGRVVRPSFTQLKLDGAAKLFLARHIGMLQRGDDALLSRLAQFITRRTHSDVLAASDYLLAGVAKTDRPRPGLFAGRQASPNLWDIHWRDMKKGRAVLRRLSGLDLGQAVVMAEGQVLAIETMTGTDAMMGSVRPLMMADTTAKGAGPSVSNGGNKAGRKSTMTVRKRVDRIRPAVLVKDFKKGQHKKLDAPTIGVDTIRQAHRVGLKGIFFHHRGNIINPVAVKLAVKQYGLFLWLF